LVEERVPTKTCKVQVFSEAHQTFFDSWTKLVEENGVDAGMRLRIYLDNAYDDI
jgi:hypothetical protein